MSEERKPLLERELDSLEAIRERILKDEPWCRMADELEKNFKDIFLSASGTYGVGVCFNLKAVKDIVPVLRFLAQRGLKHTGLKKNGSSLGWNFHRREGDDRAIVLSMSAYFDGQGQCKTVQVGEKLVPVYEVRCGAGLEKLDEMAAEELEGV